jgi:flagellar basal body rod protein FlgB
MNDARMNYNAAINFYEQSMGMIQTAIRIPGK